MEHWEEQAAYWGQLDRCREVADRVPGAIPKMVYEVTQLLHLRPQVVLPHGTVGQQIAAIWDAQEAAH